MRVSVQMISDVMRATRKQAGLSQTVVARRLGISQSALSKMERGLLTPSAIQWYEFCVMTEISPNCLLTGTGAPGLPGSAGSGAAASEAAARSN